MAFGHAAYGAPTRLLDWTRSPFVAVYFAFAGNEDKDAALWWLNEPVCRVAHGNGDFAKEIGFATDKDSEGQRSISLNKSGWTQQEHCRNEAMRHGEEWPLVVIPAIADERIRAQQGLFTFHGSLSALTKECPTETLWRVPNRLTEHHETNGEDRESWRVAIESRGPASCVQKIRLRAAWRRQALRVLQDMNITRDVLFPGLDGIGRAATLQIQCGDALSSEMRRRLLSQLYGNLERFT